jgi:predicted nucleotide-binding protein
MTSDRKHLFVSYAQHDAEIVSQFVDQLNYALKARVTPVDIWMDRAALQPGDDWQQSIREALLNSVGLLVFVSPALMQSEFIRSQLGDLKPADQERLIIPILLPGVPREFLKSASVPVLEERQGLKLRTGAREELTKAAIDLASDIHAWVKQHPHAPPPLGSPEAEKLAGDTAESVRTATSRQSEDVHAAPDSVFVVHGHDEDTLRDVCSALSELGIRPVVLSEIQGSAQSLLQKFFITSKEARFAIVILTSDDYGASRVQYDAKDVAERALQFRPRQNVILELGFFYGYLGWEKVFVLIKRPDKVFPNFERPSDLDGAVFDPIDDGGKWKTILAEKLRDAGFRLRVTPGPALKL